jgi:DNA topoisomerase VI subunit B
VHQLQLQVAEDHVERLTKVKKPILAIEELIWNSLDADATEVRVDLTESRLGGLERITVKDNGHGILPAVCDNAFASLGGSPKLRKSISPTGRQIFQGKRPTRKSESIRRG